MVSGSITNSSDGRTPAHSERVGGVGREGVKESCLSIKEPSPAYSERKGVKESCLSSKEHSLHQSRERVGVKAKGYGIWHVYGSYCSVKSWLYNRMVGPVLWFCGNDSSTFAPQGSMPKVWL